MESCPRCGCTLPDGANFCPYCGRRVGAASSRLLWLTAGLLGGLLGAGLVLSWQLLRERRRWRSLEPSSPERTPEVDEELMDF